MTIFNLHDDVLEIEDEPPRKKLSEHLAEILEPPDFVYHFDIEKYKQCKDFVAGIDLDKIKSIKFHHWDKSYLCMLVGIIAQHHQTVSEIDLTHCGLRDTDVSQIVTLLNSFPEVKKINLNGNYISNEGAITLTKAMINFPQLVDLDLSDNDIGYSTCRFIEEQLRDLGDLKRIDLSDNHNPDEIISAQEALSPSEVAKAREYVGELADEFQNGDLLYGLHAGLPAEKGRNPIHTALVKLLKQQEHHQLIIINPFSDWVINSNNFERAYKRDLIRFKEFQQAVSQLYPSDPKEPFIRGWSEHKIICKLGVVWAKLNDKKIHYILDDLRMEEFSSSNRNRADTSVTESEIKFIARFYELLKDSVQFWRTDKASGKLVKAQPPWLDPALKHYWEAYMKAQEKKMRHFPKGSLSKAEVVDVLSKRKSLSLIAYKEAFDVLFRDMISKTAEPTIQALILGCLDKLVVASTKYDLEKMVFELADEYKKHAETLKDDYLESFLDKIIKKAQTYSQASEDSKFFFRRPMQARVYKDQVLDMQMLFDLADELRKNTQGQVFDR